MLCNYSKLVTLYVISEVHFRLLGTNGFQVKEENGSFTAARSNCRQKSSNVKISRRRFSPMAGDGFAR